MGASNFGAVLRADDLPDLGIEQPKVVVDLGDGPDRGAGGPDRVPLLQRDGRPHVPEVVHVGPVELFEEHLGVGGEGLDVAPLPLGEDRVEGQGGLARSRQAGDHRHGVVRDPEAHVLEVVLTRTLYDEFGLHGDIHLLYHGGKEEGREGSDG